MAPDINSLPASPRLEQASSRPTSTTASRRTSALMSTTTNNASTSTSTSTAMPPPTQPASATNPRSPPMSTHENTIPMRHPRPLTAAELYLECEKEQEAVVNRLTRELTALRAQSASVASNASISSTSTSASLLPVDITDPNPTHQLTGATHPTPSRRHRTSSSASSRSMATPSTAAFVANSNTSTHPQVGSTVSVPHGVSQASAERAAAAGGSSMSRQTSISASGGSTPARQSMELPRMPGSLTLPHRPSLSRDPSTNTISSTHAQPGTPAPHRIPSPALSPYQGTTVTAAMQHYADTASYRTEMEIVKAENETLRQRVRALERALRTRRRDSSQSDVQRPELASRSTRESMESNRAISLTSPPPSAGLGVSGWADGGIGGVAGPRERSESQSTTASSRRAIGVTEEELRVGESASSIGAGRV